MCGFTVLFKKKKNYNIKKKEFFKSSSKIAHRGPDDHNNYIDQNIIMDFYRLSIMDLSLNGRQPMKSFTGDLSWSIMVKFITNKNSKKKLTPKNLKGLPIQKFF